MRRLTKNSPTLYYLGGALLLILLILIYRVIFHQSSTYSLAKQNTLLVEENKELNEELLDLKSQLLMLQTNAKLNQQTLEQTRQTILLLKKQIYQQQQDISTYKLAINKQITEPSIIIKDFIVQASEQPYTYRYKLVLVRTGKANKPVTGLIQLFLNGTASQTDNTISLAWSMVSIDPNYQDKIPFDFTQMTMIPEGTEFAELTLPIDFIPQSIKVMVYIDGEKQPIKQEFNWTEQN